MQIVKKRTYVVKVTAIAIAIFIICLIPVFTVEVVPEWSITITDETGQPIKNELVIQSWRNDSLEFWKLGENVEETTTNDLGQVSFPSRRIRVSILAIAASTVRDLIASADIHSSSGNASLVFCPRREGCAANFREGQELPTRIIVK